MARPAGSIRSARWSLQVAAGLMMVWGTTLNGQSVSIRGGSEDDGSVALSGDLGEFRVDDRPVGTLIGVFVRKRDDDSRDRVNLQVRLDHPGGLDAYRDCVFTTRDDDDSGIYCTPKGDIDNQDLEVVGDITFEPKGGVRPLYAPRQQVERRRIASTRRSHSGQTGHKAASLRMRADSSSAVLVVRDQHGRAVVQLSADSDRAFFRIRDSSGREVVRFRADSTGLSGRIRPDHRN